MGAINGILMGVYAVVLYLPERIGSSSYIIIRAYICHTTWFL